MAADGPWEGQGAAAGMHRLLDMLCFVFLVL